MLKLLLFVVLANCLILSSGTYLSNNYQDSDEYNKSDESNEDSNSNEDDELDAKYNEYEKRGEYENENAYYEPECRKNCEGNDYPNCNNALQSFNEAVLRTSTNLFKSYIEATRGTRETGVIAPLGTLLLIGSLAWFGKGETGVECYDILGLSSRQQIQCVFGLVNGALNNVPYFYGASDVYGNFPFNFTKDFEYVLKYVVEGVALNVNYCKPYEAIEIMNDQIASETNNKVQYAIKDPSYFDCSTELVGFSATYFSSPWEIEFELSESVTEFIIAPGKTVPGRFYTQTAVYDYALIPSLRSRVARIYYKEKKLSLVIILPLNSFSGVEPIDILVKNPVEWYYYIDKKLEPTMLNITIPAFQDKTCADTRELLIDGTDLKTIYSSETINLYGAIKNNKQAGVSVGLQTHILDIPSEGGPVPKLPKNEKIVEFTANTPHLFFVFITDTNTLLYTGITRRPTDGTSYCS